MNNKASERQVFEQMVSKPKVAAEKKDKKNFNAIMNRIINYLRKNEKFCSLTEINRELKDVDLKSNKEFLTFLATNSQKLKYDERTEIFSLKSKYQIRTIDELKDLIRTSENGLPEDEELTDSYPGIRSDLEKLKRDNYVKVITNEEKKFNVLFYRDTADNVEKLLIDNELRDAVVELRRIWKDEISFYTRDDETFLRKRQRINEDFNRKGEKRQRRANRRIANTHLSLFKNIGH
jgi:hypothetical protein